MTVHPHVRGDNTSSKRRPCVMNGSPPRAWGQQQRRQRRQQRLRFTPTCVGTTCTRLGACHWHAVHPHVRGDNSQSARARAKSVGSPPRAWGQRPVRAVAARTLRFTPTCVGTTASMCAVAFRAAVHPHVRGDNLTAISVPCLLCGSPPRAWGQRKHTDNRLFVRRFTPTCVGTTSGRRPPPIRPRFTPTCVGTTAISTAPARMPSVHPHVRGDNLSIFIGIAIGSGSPPRAWGQRSRVCRAVA